MAGALVRYPMLESFLHDRETQLRLLRFLVVGGGAALFQFLLLPVLKKWMRDTPAFTLSWAISTAGHYFANRFWALPSSRPDTAQQVGEYLLAVGVNYLISLLMFRLLRRKFNLSAKWAALWAVPPSTVVSFLILNYRVFGR